jgi:deazaflavin-dependent oxidoreductase (nitroreductase family)
MESSNFTNALESTREVELTVKGRTSGRETTRPVWFVQEGEKLNLLPLHGSKSQWYRNVVEAPNVRLAAGGADVGANATPVTDADKVRDVVEKFRAKYGAGDVEGYYPNQDVAVEVPLG